MGNIGSSSNIPPPPPPPYLHYNHPYTAGNYPAMAGAGPQHDGYVHVERHKAVTVRNDVNIHKETLRLEADPHNPGRDAAVPGSITVYFFAQEDAEYNLKTTKESLLKPVTVAFKEGQGQEFRQPCGTGIDVSLFEESELSKVGDAGVFPIAIKAEAAPSSNEGLEGEEHGTGASNSWVALAVF